MPVDHEKRRARWLRNKRASRRRINGGMIGLPTGSVSAAGAARVLGKPHLEDDLPRLQAAILRDIQLRYAPIDADTADTDAPADVASTPRHRRGIPARPPVAVAAQSDGDGGEPDDTED